MALLPRQQFTDPDAFQEYMAVASSGVSVQTAARGGLKLDQSLALLPRTAMFWLENTNLEVARPANGELSSLTIPVHGGFDALVGETRALRGFSGDEAYLLPYNRDFAYRARGTATVLVANLLALDLRKKAWALGHKPGKLRQVISKRTPSGGALVRFAHYFWRELQVPDGLWSSPTALAEMEDCLVSLMALAATTQEVNAESTARSIAVQRAEDFLIQHLTNPVTRAEIARAAGVSISTLVRGFRARHGVGPMTWLRARRLEAAYAELHRAVPGEVSVTEVAARYGFNHGGRFAADYSRSFGENPSRTLRR